MYSRRASPGFGNQTTPTRRAVTKGKTRVSPLEKPRAKPLKRPSQARAKFTVQAIYDAFVRIWRAHGWAGLTTRAIALETGISVGTLYEYFPNKNALLSGYVRHGLDRLLTRIESDVVAATGLSWQERVRRWVRLVCGVEPVVHFDAEMLLLEGQFSELKHHRRVYEELATQLIRVLAACKDLPRPIDAEKDAVMVKSLYTAVFGARRYFLLIQARDLDYAAWVGEMERLCLAALGDAPAKEAL
ncbi:MAG TPA: TetR/AcrR family transcriptional regulator [Burkholderiaceae bacterium]|nr:TetR/AcrR family transcriptional regulator [Burkholderiaceae bacterium]